jgi:hypothetical protein
MKVLHSNVHGFSSTDQRFKETFSMMKSNYDVLRVELISKSNETLLEDCINKSISDKKVIDIKFTHFVGHDNVGVFSALVIYED